MSSSDYIKFLTEQFVRYMNRPKNERKKEKPPMPDRWFGMIPAALKISARKWLRR